MYVSGTVLRGIIPLPPASRAPEPIIRFFFYTTTEILYTTKPDICINSMYVAPK